jgi:hypothetical protein
MFGKKIERACHGNHMLRAIGKKWLTSCGLVLSDSGQGGGFDHGGGFGFGDGSLKL